MAKQTHAVALAVALREGLWLNASSDRAWISRSEPQLDAPTDTAAVRWLLDGAVAAGLRLCASDRSANPPLTPIRWIWRLVGYFHLTHSTTAALEFAADRFAAADEPELASWARVRAREESNHDLLALRDLRAMDVDPERALAALDPHPSTRLVDWFRASVHAADPIGCVGYAYTIERLAMEVGPAELAAVDAMLPDGVRATRCMRVHSSAGSDADHVDETVALVAKLPAARRDAIVHAAFHVACLAATPPPDGHPDDAAIARRLIGIYELQP